MFDGKLFNIFIPLYITVCCLVLVFETGSEKQPLDT